MYSNRSRENDSNSNLNVADYDTIVNHVNSRASSPAGRGRRPSPQRIFQDDEPPNSADPLRSNFNEFDTSLNSNPERESFIDPSHHPNHSPFPGSSAYHSVGGPFEEDRISAESSNSGTKVGSPMDSHSPSYNKHGGPSPIQTANNSPPRDWTSRDSNGNSSVGEFPASPSSLQSHASSPNQYYPTGNGQHPYSNHRYRQGSFNSGLDSARASTIGTDHVPSIGYASSRTALNHEWGRASSELGLDPKDSYKDGLYGRRDSGFDSGELAVLDPANQKIKNDGIYVPIPPSSPALNQSTNEKMMMGDNIVPPKPETALVLNRANRLAWIDGLRGFASLIIFTHHFSDLTWSTSHPDTLAEGSFEGFIRFVFHFCSRAFYLTSVVNTEMVNWPLACISSWVEEF